MDINCTHACFYQADGKCNLNELPAYEYTQNSFAEHNIDCPYYTEPF